jgi:hypothetical protein
LQTKTFQLNDSLSIQVNSVNWQGQLLHLKMTVRNSGNGPAGVGALHPDEAPFGYGLYIFHLVDDAGASYTTEITKYTGALQSNTQISTNLNPGVAAEAGVTFQVPRKNYVLHLDKSINSGATNNTIMSLQQCRLTSI